MLFGFDALAFPDRVDAGNKFSQWQYRRLSGKRVSHPPDSRVFGIRLSSYGDNQTWIRFNNNADAGWWSAHD